MVRISQMSEDELRRLVYHMNAVRPDLISEALRAIKRDLNKAIRDQEKKQEQQEEEQKEQKKRKSAKRTQEKNKQNVEETKKEVVKDEKKSTNDGDDDVSTPGVKQSAVTNEQQHKKKEVVLHGETTETLTTENTEKIKDPITHQSSNSEEDVEGCYLVFDSSSSGRLMIYYSKLPIANAVGFWKPGSGNKIQRFKFKKNLGRSVLIGNCAAGIAGRKNYYSGWCQYIRLAKAMSGTVRVIPLWGEKEGLDVDIYVYYKAAHKTIKVPEEVDFDVTHIDAVTCLPKHSTLFDEVANIDLNHWMTISSKGKLIDFIHC